MALFPYHGGHRSAFDEMMGDMRSFERDLMNPYWRTANHLNFNSATDIGEVVNDDKKFAVKLDVSHFRPEELKVSLDGRQLTIEGHHESRTDHGMTERTFKRRFVLPENVDVNAVHSALTNDGHLAIEGPKTASAGRHIPIKTPSGHAISNQHQKK